MIARRITISRDGTVRLRGKATKYRVVQSSAKSWELVRVSDGFPIGGGTMRRTRAYLETLTDEELLA